MSLDEFDDLVVSTASMLRIPEGVLKRLKSDLYEVSAGHPYVTKVLLSEVSKTGKIEQPKRLLQRQDDILDALFERTYARITPAARRVFLALSMWRSTVPVMALEAVMLSSGTDMTDIGGAVEELERSSFVEVTSSPDGEDLFVSTPLVASVFGQRKLQVDSLKYQVEVDVGYLQLFGASRPLDVRHGIGPRVARLFSSVSAELRGGQRDPEQMMMVLEYVARQYPPAWMKLAELHYEIGGEEHLAKARDAVRNYLERSPDEESRLSAWKSYKSYCWKLGDVDGQLLASLEIAQHRMATLADVSTAANEVNHILSGRRADMDPDVRYRAITSLIKAMEDYMDELSATDFSRLAWLYLHRSEKGDKERAKELASEGLKLDGHNEHCQRIFERT